MEKNFPILTDRMIGDWVQEQRKKACFSLNEVAAALRVRKNRWRMIEQGQIPITIQTFARLFLFLDPQPTDFFGVRLESSFANEVDPIENLGQQLRQRRLEAGFSLRALGVVIGKSHTAINNLEHGSRRIGVRPLFVLDHLLEREGDLFLKYFQFFIDQEKTRKNQLVEIMVGKEKVIIPSSFSDLTTRKQYWREMLAPTLWCLAVKGRSTAQDIALLTGGDARSIHTAMRRLNEFHLVESFKAYLLGSIKLYQLTDIGKMVCRGFGWEVRKSELDLFFDYHQGRDQLRHTAAVLYFAYRARVSGYQIELVPDMSKYKTRCQPDILISTDLEEIYFEVETRARVKSDKWSNQVALQGFAAFCTITSIQRARIEEEIQDCGIDRCVSFDLSQEIVLPGQP